MSLIGIIASQNYPRSTFAVLAVAGGGGGMFGKSAQYAGSGGGAGEVYFENGIEFNSGTTYTITVGGGGTGAAGVNVNGGNGSNSTITGSGFTTITADFGEGGLFNTGSGGASGNGFAGGAPDPNSSGGAGGGATAVGQAGGDGRGGAGTDAYTSYGAATSTGDNVSSVYWYGSGGSGQGGVNSNTKIPGGGGYRTTDKNGIATTGGGGAGGNDGTGNGGAGVVIIRQNGTYTASATTGSPTRVVSGGFTYYTFTGSGSITI